MRITIRVRPGASRTAVGGAYESPDGSQLIVSVTARAVNGKATKAVLDAVADAFDVRRHRVALVSGARSRTKVIEVDGGAPARLEGLLRGD